MWIFWGINIIVLAMCTVSMVKEFNHKGQVSEIVTKDLDLDNLHIKSLSTDYDEILMSFGDLKLSDESLLSNEIKLKISKAKDDRFTIIKNNSARGNNSKSAYALARDIQNNASVKENVFEFEDVIIIGADQKWRDQHVNIDVQVPVGKTIEFDNSQKRFSIHTDEGLIYGRQLKGKIFEMTDSGLICKNCEQPTQK